MFQGASSLYSLSCKSSSSKIRTNGLTSLVWWR